MADIIDPLMPPYRFERIQSQVYRGGYPKPRNFRFLRRQRLKTIVSLIPDDQDSLLDDFCQVEGIERIVIQVESPNENVTVTESTVSRCLELVTNPDKTPLYLHCLDGSNVTGVVVMCLRKLQLWRIASYQSEYLRFEQDGEIIPEESEFVECYSGRALMLPNPYADWLWPGRLAASHGSNVNSLPFKNNVHPVMPHVRLRQRMSTDICQADLSLATSRSATDLASKDSGVTSRGSGMTFAAAPAAEFDGALTQCADRSLLESWFSPQQQPTHALSETASGQGAQANGRPLSLAMSSVKPVIVSHEPQSAQIGHVTASDQLNLHQSFSTGALPDLTPSTRGRGSDAQRQRVPLSDAHEMLEPVLAALASEALKATEPGLSIDSSKTTKAGTRSSLKPLANFVKGATRESGVSQSLAAASVQERRENAGGLRQVPAPSRSSGKSVATEAASDAAAVVKEIALSLLVQALAIEGLGM
ncbi:protein-tyrosine-phosphatase [Coemansia thaxteri]|nr:protein-tyrosine-phosphatase [Coemansia thaxteri]KAJ2467577.1 protein-tyrosine-phosphatase [Coemansia sp. RSA 2322]